MISDAPDETSSKHENKHADADDSSTNEQLRDIVETAVPESKILSDVGSEVRYQLPLSAASEFAAMFEGLDEQAEKGAIESYGVSMTTLDEVFLQVARGETTERTSLASSLRIDPKTTITLTGDEKSARSRMDLEKEGLFFRHVGASLMKKRAANFKRDKKAWVCTTIVPSIFVLIGTVAAPERNLEPILLDLNYYNPDVTESPRNPIAFNSPDNPYLCQPGICAYYQEPVVVSNETSELYFFCGYQAKLGLGLNGGSITFESSLDKCSLTDTSDIINTLTGTDGAVPKADDVETVLGVRLSLHLRFLPLEYSLTLCPFLSFLVLCELV